MAEKASSGKINTSSYKVSKSGSVRQAGELPAGDASTSRGATARAGTLANNSGGEGGSGDSRQHWYGSFADGTRQKFRPTTKGGKVRG
jgi:hypothetical protein